MPKDEACLKPDGTALQKIDRKKDAEKREKKGEGLSGETGWETEALIS
jgi:hypothetical protein